MVANSLHAGSSTLREILKERTAQLHDTLDQALGESALDAVGYAEFLARQYAARAPIERWARANLDSSLIPPMTSELIAADLAELGDHLPAEETFSFPADGDPLGLAWAFGGSALGNKALLTQRRKAGLSGPQRFLGDKTSAAYFGRIMPKLARPVDSHVADAAVEAADAVFRTFLAAARRPHQRATA